MWDDPFNTKMLGEYKGIVVNCPEEDLERELAAILGAFGIKYPNGQSLLSSRNVWGAFGDKFCYFISGESARRGPKEHAETDPYYGTFKKCTFYGEQLEEDISDESFFAIIGR